MRFLLRKLVGAAGLCLAAFEVSAASLQVEPVLVEVIAPGAASTVTLRNDGTTPVSAQIRVYRWSQAGGEEKLEPTDDVVASPPAAMLAPGSTYVARIVRVTNAPALREESYRLFIDQLPNAAQQRSGSVNLIVRHSIPVFFRPADSGSASVVWSAEISKRNLVVTARNTGARRLRIAALKVRDDKGSSIIFADGLVGYALADSTMRWSTPLAGRGFGQGQVSVTAQGDTGPIHATAPLKATR